MDDSSPVTFKSVRSMWMARDNPTGPKRKTSEAPEDLKDREGGYDHMQLPRASSAPSITSNVEEDLASRPMLPKFPGVGTTRPEPDTVTKRPSNQQDGDNGAQGPVKPDLRPENHPEEAALSEADDLEAPIVQGAGDHGNARGDGVHSTSPISDVATEDLLSQLPDISESACTSEDGDRSLSSPGSDEPIRRAAEEVLQKDSEVCLQEQGKPSHAATAEAGRPVSEANSTATVEHHVNTSGPERPVSEARQNTATVRIDAVQDAHALVDDLENAKPVTRIAQTSPEQPGQSKDDRKSLSDSRSLLSARSLVTSVEMSHHQHVVECLHKQISELTHELNTLKTDRDVQQLVNLPPSANSPLIAELQNQLLEKDKRLRALEKENGDFKRNQMIQAVELQELNDHIRGLEKQRAVMEKHAFPTLPPLQTIREPMEEDAEDANHLRMAKLANAALRSAEEELAALKKGEHKRQQLEVLLEHARLKISSLEGKNRPPSAPSQVGRMWEETKRASSDGVAEELRRQLEASRAEVASLHAQVVDLNKAQGVAMAVAEEARAMLAQKMQEEQTQGLSLAHSKETLSQACQTVAGGQQLGEQGSTEAVNAEDESRLAAVVRDMEEVRKQAAEGIEVMRVMEECLAHVDPLVSVQDQRDDLSAILQAIITRTQTMLVTCSKVDAPPDAASSKSKPEGRPPSSHAVVVVAETMGREGKGEMEQLASRVKELERSERFLKDELENASTALAKARAQNTASSIELGILRNQLEGVTNRPGGARAEDEGLQGRVQQLEREREQLIMCLEGLNRSKPAEEVAGSADVGAAAEMVQSLVSEKHELESAVGELRHLREAMQVENQEVRLQLLHVQRENGELQEALQCARSKIAEGHEELVLRKKEINTLSKNLKAVSAALEATNEYVQPSCYMSRTSHDHGSPSSVTSENETALQRELAAAREEIKGLQEKMSEDKKHQEDSIDAASERLRHELSLSKQEINELREQVAQQKTLIEDECAKPKATEQEQELVKVREENTALREKMSEMEKQMELKKQKLALLAEYKMQMVKQHGELCIKDT